MDTAPQEQEAAVPPPSPPDETAAAGAAPEAPAPPPLVDPEVAARRLSRYVTCRPSKPVGGCGGLGWAWVVKGAFRHKAVCPCIAREHARQAAQAQAAANAEGRRAAELLAAAEGQSAGPVEGEAPEPRHVPQGARDRLERLKRELAKIDGAAARAEQRHADALQAKADAVAALDGKLAALSEEEQTNARDQAQAEADRKLAASQLEGLRARMAGLQTDIAAAEGRLALLGNEAGQFGARRMEIAAELQRAKDAPVEAVDDRQTLKRKADLQERLDLHLAQWPELREGAPS